MSGDLTSWLQPAHLSPLGDCPLPSQPGLPEDPNHSYSLHCLWGSYPVPRPIASAVMCASWRFLIEVPFYRCES